MIKNKKLFVVLVFAFILLLSCFLFGCTNVGGKLSEEEQEKQLLLADINDFIKFMKTYTPGEMDENGYSSEFWDIKFVAGDKWIMSEEDVLNDASLSGKKLMLDEAKLKFKEKGIEDDVISAWEKACYADYEMCAYYPESNYSFGGDSNKIIGTCSVSVMSTYNGNDELSVEQYFDGVKAELGMNDLVINEQQLGNEMYKYIDVPTTNDKGELITRTYVKVDNHMLLTICCKWLSGSDVVLESFLEQISAYK